MRPVVAEPSTATYPVEFWASHPDGWEDEAEQAAEEAGVPQGCVILEWDTIDHREDVSDDGDGFYTGWESYLIQAIYGWRTDEK